MKSNVEELSSVQRKISITVCQEKVNKAFNDAYKRYQKKSRISGFRAGKAPLYLIKNNYAGQISYEVSDALLDNSLKSALLEHKLQPISRPHVGDFNQPSFDHEFCFTATVEVFPKIPLEENYKGLELSYPVKNFDEKEVGVELEALKRHYAKTAPLEGADVALQEKGHLAVVSYDSFLGEEKIERLCKKSVRAAMSFSELPKEIEAALVGLKKGEEKEIKTVLSEDSEFGKKEIKISLNLEDILSFELPELNDDFAKELKQESMDELKAVIKKNLEERVEGSNRSQKENIILEALASKVSFDVPPVIINQVIDGMIKEMYGNSQGVETLVKDVEFRKRLAPEAIKRAKNTLLLWEVAKAEKIEVSDAQIKDYIKKSLGESADEKKIEELFSSSKERLNETLVFEKTLEAISRLGKITAEVQK